MQWTYLIIETLIIRLMLSIDRTLPIVYVQESRIM